MRNNPLWLALKMSNFFTISDFVSVVFYVLSQAWNGKIFLLRSAFLRQKVEPELFTAVS